MACRASLRTESYFTSPRATDRVASRPKAPRRRRGGRVACTGEGAREAPSSHTHTHAAHMRAPSLYSNGGASSRSLLPPGPTLSSQYIRTAIVPRRAAATALRQQQRPRHRPFMTRGARGPAQDPDATPTPPPPPRRRRLARRVPSPRGACGSNPCPGGSLLSDAPNHRIGSQRESATADDERRCAVPQGDRHREQQQLPRHCDDRRRGAEQPTWRHLHLAGPCVLHT